MWINIEFSKEYIQMTEKYFLRQYSTFLAFWVVKIKATLRELIKKKQITNAGIDVRKRGILIYLGWKLKLIQPLCKTVWRVLKKLEIDPLYDPASLFLNIFPKDSFPWYRDTCSSIFVAIFPQYASPDEQTMNMWYRYKILFNCKQNEIISH